MSEHALAVERYLRLSAWMTEHWREMNSRDYVRLPEKEFTADCSRQATLQNATRIALGELLRVAPELGVSVGGDLPQRPGRVWRKPGEPV